MKKIMSLFLLIAISTATFAADGELDKFFEKHKDKEGFSSMSLTQDVFQMMAKLSEEYQQDLVGVFEGIEAVRILRYKTKDQASGEGYVNEFKKIIGKRKYDELMTGNSSGTHFTAKAVISDDYVQDVVLVIHHKDEFGFVHIDGKVPFDKVQQLIKLINK